MLFLGWLVAAFLVVGAINLYLRFFGLPKGRSRNALDSSSHPAATVKGGESVQWINSALSWLYLHYNSTPELIESWLRALNDTARKHPCEYQIKFDRVQAGSTPPKFTQVNTDVSTKEHLTLRAGVESADVTLLVSAITQTATNIRVASCDVTIARLHGQLKIHSAYSGVEEIETSVQFVEPPDVQLTVTARNYDSNLNLKAIEDVVRASLSECVTTIYLPSKGGYPHFHSAGARPAEYGTKSKDESFEAKLAKSTNLVSNAGARSMKDKRLLVKVIKANGLGDKDFGCSDPYCIVEMNEPLQKHTTSVVKNTVNPFWDEHFLFDLDETTKQVKFEVFDREKPPGDDFLGRAVIPMSELRRMPSSRQIVPLTGKPGSATTTSGSVTIEFLFMEPADAAHQPGVVSDLSPRRRIETTQRTAPGGVNVTTTTMTTERPSRDQISADSYNDSLSRVEKSDGMSTDYSGYSSRASSHLGAHEAGLSATSSQGIRERGRPLTSSSLTASGYDGSRQDQTSPTIPTIKMTDSPENRMVDETLDPLNVEVKKSKSFASTLKKRFSRSPKKSRSQSADRTSSLREGSLLKPPSQSNEFGSHEVPEDGLRKPRSNSFSSSLKNLFKKKKKEGGTSSGFASRESSVSRASTRSHPVGPVASGSRASPSLQESGGRGMRTPSSDYSGGGGGMYSSSVPANVSPLYDQYNSH
jgi:hypothetical protein